MNSEQSFVCPLASREMWDSECYEVQLVRSHFIKEDVMDFRLDRKKADELCEHCLFNQLQQCVPKTASAITQTVGAEG
jgi:hypothetical protein